MDNLTRLARQTLILLEQQIIDLGYTPVIHFELEGGFKPANTSKPELDYQNINKVMRALKLQAELKPEYWRFQWEYVSLFNGQSALVEADNLHRAIKLLPTLLRQFGAEQVHIKPVLWTGDIGALANGSSAIFSPYSRDIHVPNAVQLNLSLLDNNGRNVMVDGALAERIQQRMLQTSYACSAIFLPEEEAYERLKLRSHYGLEQELSSPVDISGGHQGSIALYRQWGKHGQPMGVEPLLLDAHSKPLTSQQNWHKTARIEHRLGASSIHFHPHLNVVFALANVFDALENLDTKTDPTHCQSLPSSLHGNKDEIGALALFVSDNWLPEIIHKAQLASSFSDNANLPTNLGIALKQAYVDYLNAQRTDYQAFNYRPFTDHFSPLDTLQG